MNDSLDYATLDTSDPTTLNKLIQEQLGRGGPRRKKAPRATEPRAVVALPLGAMGTGQQLARELLAVAKQCGDDRGCWSRKLAEGGAGTQESVAG